MMIGDMSSSEEVTSLVAYAKNKTKNALNE